MNEKDEDSELLEILYTNDSKDGWCGHDIGATALRNIIRRVRQFDDNRRREANHE